MIVLYLLRMKQMKSILQALNNSNRVELPMITSAVDRFIYDFLVDRLNLKQSTWLQLNVAAINRQKNLK